MICIVKILPSKIFLLITYNRQRRTINFFTRGLPKQLLKVVGKFNNGLYEILLTSHYFLYQDHKGAQIW